MADQFTTSLGVPRSQTTDTSTTDESAPTQINGFTGEIEPASPLNLAPSPADQRILAAPPHTDPLPVLADRAVKSRDDGNGADLNLEEHRGGSLTEDALPGETPLPIIEQRDTPDLNESVPLPVQHVDVPPPNDIAIDEQGATVTNEGIPYPGLDTKAYTESIDARLKAEQEGTKLEDLPEIEPPVIGEGITANDVGVPDADQGKAEEDSTPKETPVSDTPTEPTSTEDTPTEPTPEDTPTEPTPEDNSSTPVEPTSEGSPDPVAEQGPTEPSADTSVEGSNEVPVSTPSDSGTSTSTGETTSE